MKNRAGMFFVSLFGLVAAQSCLAERVYGGQWPPYDVSQCYDAGASGELAKRSLTMTECHTLVEVEGVQRAIRDAQDGKYFILEFGLWDVNSAGGVEPFVKAINSNQKSPIKYLSINLSVFNGVGDKVRSEIGGSTSAGIRATGPLAAADGPTQYTWEPISYNHSAECLQAELVKVQFMDGKELIFKGKSLASAFAPGAKFRCK